MDDIYAELAERLREELDYKREAAQMRLYGLMLDGDPLRQHPEARSTATPPRLLTMTWLAGRTRLAVADRRGQPLEERNHLATAIFHAWYGPLYRYGVIHGDPHLGQLPGARG